MYCLCGREGEEEVVGRDYSFFLYLTRFFSLHVGIYIYLYGVLAINRFIYLVYCVFFPW